MALYCYARASTSHQEESPNTQKAVALRWGIYNNKGEPEAYFVDIDVSGSVPFDERKAGVALLDVLRRGDTVIVSRMDRAFRNVRDFCFTVERFERLGVTLCLADQNCDMSTPIGKMTAQMLVVFAEFERSQIRARIKEAMQHRKRTGRCAGLHPPFGKKWQKVWDHDLKRYTKMAVPDHDEKEVMRYIVACRYQSPPLPWFGIYKSLLATGKKTRKGVEWSVARIRRAFDAEMQQQATERRDQPHLMQ